jgi:hypothetical protein
MAFLLIHMSDKDLVLILKRNTSASFQMLLQTVLMVVWLHYKAQNKNLKRNHNFWWSSRNSFIALVLRNSMWVEFFVVYRKQKNWRFNLGIVHEEIHETLILVWVGSLTLVQGTPQSHVVLLCLTLAVYEGHSCYPLAVEASARFQASLCGICGG